MPLSFNCIVFIFHPIETLENEVVLLKDAVTTINMRLRNNESIITAQGAQFSAMLPLQSYVPSLPTFNTVATNTVGPHDFSTDWLYNDGTCNTGGDMPPLPPSWKTANPLPKKLKNVPFSRPCGFAHCWNNDVVMGIYI